MKSDDIIAIVVAYNIKMNILLENIISYINFVDKVLVVDNSDRVTGLNNIRKEDKIEYISLNGNYGIAKALNIGLEYAINNKYKYALTMDQDSKFSNNLIDEYSKNQKVDVAIYSPFYRIERKLKKQSSNKNTQYLYWTMTSGNLLNLEYVKKIGMFREDFFIDAVDYEYCLRARKNGYKILQCNKAVLIHNPGITKIKKFLFIKYKYGYMSTDRLYYQVRNLSCIAKEYKCLRARVIILIKLLKIILLFNNKKDFLKAFRDGIDDYKNNNYGKRIRSKNEK